MKLVTAAEMREIDRRATEEFGIPGTLLMENAGAAVARAAEALWRELGGGPVVILCGPGNNGGDGLVAARHLHNRGVPVQALLAVPDEKLQGDAALNFALARSFGVPLAPGASPAALRRHLQGAGLIVDALLGTGLTGPVRAPLAGVIRQINQAEAPVLAVDVPSGLCTETGAVLGEAVQAAVTLTLGLPKVGMYCFPARECCGEIEVADISLPRELLEAEALRTELITPELAAECLPLRLTAMNKGEAGRLLIVAGSLGMTGAAALCANAAVRAGAGLVYLGIPEGLNAILEAKCTEPITLPLPQTESGGLSAAAAPRVLELLRELHVNAVVLGPGLGREPETAELVARLVREVRVPLVVDADALNALAGKADLLAKRKAPTVITPHPGEMARLLGGSIEQVQADRLTVAREVAERWRCTVILKGAGTVVAAPDGRAFLNATGNHGLASGGTGDVLAGMLGAFLAGGSAVPDAATAAVYYHGRAADLYVSDVELSARSLCAGDLVELLPLALGEEDEV